MGMMSAGRRERLRGDGPGGGSGGFSSRAMLRQPVRERLGQDELDDLVDADTGQASQVRDLRQHWVAESYEPPVPGPNPASHAYTGCIPVASEIREWG
jgi:hypothetical protein